MSKNRTRLAAATLAAAAGVAVVAVAPAQAAQDTDCMRAGIATLKGAGLLPAVAKGGVPISFAVEELKVTVREGADISGVPDPIPFSLLLADHRAGDDSLFVYPWCS
ncbi:MAG: hypothetical protein WBL35_14790 [Ornithinibacter sp.]